ncbi:NAD(P)H-dependent oxidoreductase [Desulfatiferula olefinivorans]
MKICVLSGSPKGELSVTLQSVHYIAKHRPDHAVDIVHVGRDIKALEKDPDKLADVMARVARADLVILACPVYVFNVPSQFKRFIEIIWDNPSSFKGKYAALLTTSIHFFDHCAHTYLRAVCEDLGMHVAGSFSADSYDLLAEGERSRLLAFADQAIDTAVSKRPCAKAFMPVVRRDFAYRPGSSAAQPTDKKVIVMIDEKRSGSNVPAMARAFADRIAGAEVIDLSEVRVSGGCLGCVQCGFDHQCVYADKDDLIALYETRVKPADIIVMAGEIRDRFLSSTWKRFFDRGFYNTHTPTMTGKQLCFLVSGPLSQVFPLREVIEAFTEWQGANLVDIVTDEGVDSAAIDALIQNAADRCLTLAGASYVAPATFLGRAGMKVFRDDVFGRHRFVFQADHAYFESHGLYDFPHDDKRAMETNKTMFELTEDPQMRDAIRKMLKSEMVKPHQKVVETK